MTPKAAPTLLNVQPLPERCAKCGNFLVKHGCVAGCERCGTVYSLPSLKEIKTEVQRV